TTRAERPRPTSPEPSRPRTRARRVAPDGPSAARRGRPAAAGVERPRATSRARPAPVPPPPHRAALGRPGARHADPGRRIKWVRLAFLLLFVAVVARLGQLQVVARDELEERGELQRTRTLTLSADRGSLLDRNGGDLALSLPLPTVYADPSQVDDARATAAA